MRRSLHMEGVKEVIHARCNIGILEQFLFPLLTTIGTIFYCASSFYLSLSSKLLRLVYNTLSQIIRLIQTDTFLKIHDGLKLKSSEPIGELTVSFLGHF